jgi:hypothetical protein
MTKHTNRQNDINTIQKQSPAHKAICIDVARFMYMAFGSRCCQIRSSVKRFSSPHGGPTPDLRLLGSLFC